MTAIKYSVVIPASNQADHIEAVIARFTDTLSALPDPSEVVVVVNNSRDATHQICQRLAEHDSRVRVVQSQPGWGNAVRAGLGEARGEILCYTNSARTQPADLLLALKYGTVNEEAVVKASRKTRDSLVRRLGSVLFNFEGRMLFGLAIWDINGTPKVLHRALRDELALRQKGDLIDLELAVACKRRGIPIVEIPVYLTKRHGGTSTTSVRSALRMYLTPLRWIRARSRTQDHRDRRS